MLKTDHEDASDLRRDGRTYFERDAGRTNDAPDALDATDDEDERDADDVRAAVDESARPSQLWLVAACVSLVAAAALWLLDHADAAFVVAALGVVAWFLNVRAQLRSKLPDEEEEDDEEEVAEDESEDVGEG